MNELEKVIAQYQDKLNDVTSNYQQKIGAKMFDYDNDYDYDYDYYEQQKIGGKMFCLWSTTWTTNMLIAGILENKIIDKEMAKDYV